MKEPVSLEGIHVRLEMIQGDLSEIKSTLKEFNRDFNDIKADQHKCKTYWGFMGKTLTWGGLTSALGIVYAQLFGHK